MLKKLLLADVRVQIAAILLVVLAIAVIQAGETTLIIRPAVSVFFAVPFDWLLTRITVKKSFFPTSALVSGLIIGMLLPTTAGLIVFIIIPIVTVIIKHLLELLRFSNFHIFNPAASGIVLAQFIFGLPVAWWAASFSPILVSIILVLGAGYILKRLRRLWLPVTFLAAYFLILLISFKDFGQSARLLFDGTTFFFAFIMLPEPQSAPALRLWKYFFGLLVAFILFLVLRLPNFGLDFFLVSLLAANLLSYVIRYVTGKIPKYRPPAARATSASNV